MREAEKRKWGNITVFFSLLWNFTNRARFLRSIRLVIVIRGKEESFDFLFSLDTISMLNKEDQEEEEMEKRTV